MLHEHLRISRKDALAENTRVQIDNLSTSISLKTTLASCMRDDKGFTDQDLLQLNHYDFDNGHSLTSCVFAILSGNPEAGLRVLLEFFGRVEAFIIAANNLFVLGYALDAVLAALVAPGRMGTDTTGPLVKFVYGGQDSSIRDAVSRACWNHE